MITVWNVRDVNNKSDVEILRESCRKIYNNSRRLVKKSYSEETGGVNYFYDNRHLLAVEKLLFSVAEYLYSNITYIPQKKELKQIMCDLKVGDLEFNKTLLVESVINDCASDYFKDDVVVLNDNVDNPVFHCEFIIGKFKGYVNVLCRIISQNDVGFIFSRP